MSELFLCVLVPTGLSVFFLARSEWVYRSRIKMIDDDFERYKRMPSYIQMMIRFWVWNINKFKEVNNG